MTTTDNTAEKFGKNLIVILMIGLLAYFMSQSCNQMGEKWDIKRPSEIEKEDSLRTDSLLKSNITKFELEKESLGQTNSLLKSDSVSTKKIDTLDGRIHKHNNKIL